MKSGFSCMVVGWESDYGNGNGGVEGDKIVLGFLVDREGVLWDERVARLLIRGVFVRFTLVVFYISSD